MAPPPVSAEKTRIREHIVNRERRPRGGHPTDSALTKRHDRDRDVVRGASTDRSQFEQAGVFVGNPYGGDSGPHERDNILCDCR